MFESLVPVSGGCRQAPHPMRTPSRTHLLHRIDGTWGQIDPRIKCCRYSRTSTCFRLVSTYKRIGTQIGRGATLLLYRSLPLLSTLFEKVNHLSLSITRPSALRPGVGYRSGVRFTIFRQRSSSRSTEEGYMTSARRTFNNIPGASLSTHRGRNDKECD